MNLKFKIYYFYCFVMFSIIRMLNNKSIVSDSNNYLDRVKFSNKGLHNSLTLKGDCLLSKTQITIMGDNNSIIIENNAKFIDCNILVKGDNNKIIIGSKTNLKGIFITMEKNGNILDIGENTTSSGLVEVYIKEGTEIQIGKNCMLSREIIMRTSDGHSIIENEVRVNPAQSIFIGDSSWIAQRVMILKGASIPQDTVIGAGSIVTKEFKEKNTIITGVPAKVVKKNVGWKRQLIN